MVFISKSENDTERFGQSLAERLSPGAVIALRGDLGAGKTAFVRGLARGLGIDARVTSPTFAVVNEYPGETPLFHFDLYRLSDEDELYDIGWDDYLTRGGVCAVEWSEIAPGAFPEDTITVTIERIDENTRRITEGGPED